MMAYFSLPSHGESNKCPHLKCLLEGDVADTNNILKCCESTRLHHLLSMGLSEESLQMLSKGADVNSKDKDGQTALHVAVAKKSVSSFIVKIIAENTSDTNIMDIGGKSALHLAVSSANSAAVKVILQTGGNVDIQDYDGNSPLHYAFIYCLDLVETLIEHGANVELKNKLGETPLFKAIVGAEKLLDITKLIEVIELILKKGANINVQSYNGDTPLHVAGRCFKGIHKLCSSLLNNGAKATIHDFHGMTPHVPVVCGTYFFNEMAIVSEKSVVNIPTNQEMYPLHLATDERYLKIVKLLLDNGAVVDSKNEDNATALHLVTGNYREISELVFSILINKGASPNVQDVNGMTPLHNAVKYKKYGIVQLLLQNGAEVNSKNKKGETPLRYVQCVDVLEMLILKGGRVNEQDNYGRTVLHNIFKDFKKCERNEKNLSCEFSFMELYATGLVLNLLEWGASQIIKDNFGKIPADYYLFTNVQKKYEIKRTCLYNNNMTRNVQDSSKYQKLEDNCFEEIGRMKLECFGNNCLYDIFCHSGKPTFLFNKELESAIHSEDLKVKYPVYWCLLRSTYHRSRERGQLFDPALVILQTCCDLPPEMVYHILTFVDNDSLRNVIKAKEEFPFQEELGSTSKSETESDTESDWIPEFSLNYDSEYEVFVRT